MPLHILIGENRAEAEFERCARSDRPISWIVPKKAEPGDDVVFVFHHDQFVGIGVIDDYPEKDTFGDQAAYRATVRDIAVFSQSLPVADVAPRIPNWKWPNSFTKGRTTIVDVDTASKLDRMIKAHVAKVGLKAKAVP